MKFILFALSGALLDTIIARHCNTEIRQIITGSTKVKPLYAAGGGKYIASIGHNLWAGNEFEMKLISQNLRASAVMAGRSYYVASGKKLLEVVSTGDWPTDIGAKTSLVVVGLYSFEVEDAALRTRGDEDEIVVVGRNDLVFNSFHVKTKDLDLERILHAGWASDLFLVTAIDHGMKVLLAWDATASMTPPRRVAVAHSGKIKGCDSCKIAAVLIDEQVKGISVISRDYSHSVHRKEGFLNRIFTDIHIDPEGHVYLVDHYSEMYVSTDPQEEHSFHKITTNGLRFKNRKVLTGHSQLGGLAMLTTRYTGMLSGTWHAYIGFCAV